MSLSGTLIFRQITLQRVWGVIGLH